MADQVGTLFLGEPLIPDAQGEDEDSCFLPTIIEGVKCPGITGPSVNHDIE